MFSKILLLNFLIAINAAVVYPQTTFYAVTVDKVLNGSVTLLPALPADGRYPAANEMWKEAIAPQSNIPDVKDRAVPQYLTRGTLDPIIKDEAVKAYVDALVKAGQRVEYVQVGSASHAFFDWKPDPVTKATFAKYGVYYCAEMEAFFSSIFYRRK